MLSTHPIDMDNYSEGNVDKAPGGKYNSNVLNLPRIVEFGFTEYTVLERENKCKATCNLDISLFESDYSVFNQ